MPLCRFQLHATGSEITRLGWVDLERQRVFELSETLAGLLGLQSDIRLRRLNELRRSAVATFPLKNVIMRAPIDEQEVWAAGATYERSEDARERESVEADVYQPAYRASRPEIFFKAQGWRCVGDGQFVGIRADSTWDVPEPELTLVIDAHGDLAGYTIGNDMTSRSIEGEDPRYLTQAKMYHASCSLGPWIMLREELPDASALGIWMTIKRDDAELWSGNYSTSGLWRSFDELITCLWAALEHPSGAFLMSGTGIVPPSEFTLQSGDSIEIDIEGIGRLTNKAMRLEAR